MFKKYAGGLVAALGVVGVIGGYIMMAMTAMTFMALFLAKIIGIFTGPWFALTKISVFITPIFMFVGGLILFSLSGITTLIGTSVYEKEDIKQKKEKKLKDTIEVEVTNEEKH
jgi:hypothetical protein